MADIFLDYHYRRWNKCFIYRDFNYTRWTFSALIFCVYLKCASAACNAHNSTLSTYPAGKLMIPYGQPLQIFCSTKGNYTSRNLQFKKNGSVLADDTTVINETTIRLYISEPQKQSDTYYCTNNVAMKHCLNRVEVDEKPPNVTDFKCRSMNLESLKCSWSYPKTFITIDYEVSFYVANNAVQAVKANKTNNIVSCEWTLSTRPIYRQHLSYYNISLVANNTFGETKQNFSINHFAILVPDKPKNLTVVRTEPHSALLNWSLSDSIHSFLHSGLAYRIEFQVAKLTKFHRVNTLLFNATKLSKNYTFNLTDLPYPHIRYEVKVFMKSVLAEDYEEFWSYDSVFFKTKSEKPSRPPETAVGAFMTTKLNSKREIYCYWRQLEEYEHNGPNFTYRAVVKQDDRTQLYNPVKDKSRIYIDIKDASMSAVYISLKSVNSEGSSENSSYLYVPSDDNILEGPMSFTKLAYENGTYALYWKVKDIAYIENYTLFWCEYIESRSCIGRMDFTYLNPVKTSYIIDYLAKETKYQFAMSINNGIKSSGMHWIKCDISHDTVVMYEFPVTLSHEDTGKNYVTLSWKMDCTLQNDIIVAYKISYCPVIDKIDRSDQMQSKSIPHSLQKNQVNITGLSSYKTYRFTLSLNTTLGLKEVKNATADVTTLQDSPEKPVNITVTDVTNNSLIISWDPPKVRNGIIQKYVIFNHNAKIDSLKIDDLRNEKVEREHLKLKDLYAYTNYSLRVQACNSDVLCSKLDDADAVFVRTCIGPPSVIERPEINDTSELLFWEPPKLKAGLVDLYQIKRVKDHDRVEIFNTTELTFDFKFCVEVTEHESYQVRAMNLDKYLYHGAWGSSAVILTPRVDNYSIAHFGPWSQSVPYHCKSQSGVVTFLMLTGLLLIGIGMVYGSLKLYRRYKRMEDIKPELPKGLVIPEKEINKCGFGNWNSSEDDKSASSDEVRLLPNKIAVTSSDTKQGSTTPTHTAGFSDVSKLLLQRQPSLSDDACESSLQAGSDTCYNAHADQNVGSTFNTDDNEKGKPSVSLPVVNNVSSSGYVQHTISDSKSDFMQSSSAMQKPLQLPEVSATSSYVMAGLSSLPMVTAGGSINSVLDSRLPNGYVCPENTHPLSSKNFPQLGPSPTRVSSLQSLPMAPPLKPNGDNLLETLIVPKMSLESSISQRKLNSGYVSSADALLHRHLNIMTNTTEVELEPGSGAQPLKTLSPDAYCRFSWSKDPTADNLHSWLAEVAPPDQPDLSEMHL